MLLPDLLPASCRLRWKIAVFWGPKKTISHLIAAATSGSSLPGAMDALAVGVPMELPKNGRFLAKSPVPTGSFLMFSLIGDEGPVHKTWPKMGKKYIRLLALQKITCTSNSSWWIDHYRDLHLKTAFYTNSHSTPWRMSSFRCMPLAKLPRPASLFCTKMQQPESTQPARLLLDKCEQWNVTLHQKSWDWWYQR